VNSAAYYYIHLSLLLGSILFSFSCGIYKFKIIDLPSRVFCLLLGLTLISELIAFTAAKKYGNNLSVYSVFSIVQLALLALYFNFSIDVFRKWNLGLYIGATGVAAGILNIVFLEPLGTFNTNFLFFEGLCIIAMALFSFFRLLLMNDDLQLHKYPHFWFGVILVLFWSITFLNWGLYDYYSIKFKNEIWKIGTSILAINVFTYVAIGVNFLLYHKMKGAHAK